ncbi:MAG: hypothetical protein GKR90_25350 [Pseudomonadales bacterium]|nr:hypothetical protein [Pseudomonadales bacterium]
MTHSSAENRSSEYPDSHTVYSSSAALCVQYSKTVSKADTVIMEFAERNPDRKGYDWKHKRLFQLSKNDLSTVTAFFLWPWTTHELFHKNVSQGTKRVVLTSQQSNVLISYQCRTDRVRLPIVPEGQYYLRNLLMSRLFHSQPELPHSTHLQSLHRLSQDLSKT